MCGDADNIQTVSDNNMYLLLKELHLSCSDVVTSMKAKLILVTRIKKINHALKGKFWSYSGSDILKELHQIIADLH